MKFYAHRGGAYEANAWTSGLVAALGDIMAAACVLRSGANMSPIFQRGESHFKKEMDVAPVRQDPLSTC